MKKHFKLGILITVFCLIFVGGCNSGDKMTEDEFYESISSAENKEEFENSNPTQTPEPTKEAEPISEPKPTDKPSKNTDNVLVTIHAPHHFC